MNEFKNGDFVQACEGGWPDSTFRVIGWDEDTNYWVLKAIDGSAVRDVGYYGTGMFAYETRHLTPVPAQITLDEIVENITEWYIGSAIFEKDDIPLIIAYVQAYADAQN